MKLSKYTFTIEPFNYTGVHGGEEKVLRIEVRIDGKIFTEQKVMLSQAPWETEIQVYTRMAIEGLQNALKGAETRGIV